MGNDGDCRCFLQDYFISIHVPAWGTTVICGTCPVTSTNFNPRSRVGNDLPFFPIILVSSEFQSTFPRGERQTGYCFMGRRYKISIHVPAWGTTGNHMKKKIRRCNFNPRSRVGNDIWQQQVEMGIEDFNPRSRVGNDTVDG